MTKLKINRKTIPQSPWITKGLLKSIIVKNKLYKQYILHPTGDHLVKFKTYRNKLNNLIGKSKLEYYHKQYQRTNNNIRQTWKTINGIIGQRKSVSQQSILLNLMMVILLMSHIKYLILLMTSLLILDPNLPKA